MLTDVQRLRDWELARDGEPFQPVRAPCTVASALRDRGEWALGMPAAFDEEHWTFRCRFPKCDADTLHFAGLTPNCEVWLNGVRVAIANNMFLPLDIPVALEFDNVLELRFLPLGLAAKKGRPRWRSALVDDAKRRFVRATAVGHMPSWGPTYATVGPWREVVLGKRRFETLRVSARVEGNDGLVEINAALPEALKGDIFLDGVRTPMSGKTWSATLRVKDAELWWPHTHGGQRRYALSIAGQTFTEIGFRTIALDSDFRLQVNGSDVFCRGAVWTPSDPLSLGADPLPALQLARDAGFNMMRVSGNTFYESPAFYGACDALGILVWQEFAFANLDYPFTDATFAASVREEAEAFLRRTQGYASLALLCGNSEVEMQPALMGQAPVPLPFFHETLPALCAEARPDVPYVAGSPSTATRIAPRSGCSHYYGVGAYMRPMSDARASHVRFASESLGFAQLPARASQEAWRDEPWPQRVVRAELGVGDFVDVHEYYIREIFGREARELRTSDRARYTALSDIMPGEIMRRTYSEWRTQGQCHGALIWFWRDLWRSCGWGIVDADGRPKAAYHYLRRVLAPRAVLLSDEGLNGLDIHLINEPNIAHEAELSLELYSGARLLQRVTRAVSVPARGQVTLGAEAVLGRFADLTYAYRYGARPYDTLVVRWGDAPAAFHFLSDPLSAEPRAIGLSALRRGTWLHVSTRELAHTVILDSEGASDNYFHIAPGEERVIKVPGAPVRIIALNATESVRTG